VNFDPETIAREIFHVELPCKRAALKSAYRRLVLELHPDRGGTNEDFIVIQRAYEILLANPEVVFDRPLRKGRALCGVCKGTGYVFFHDDTWEPRRPCFTCFACRTTLGCKKCSGRFRVTKSSTKVWMFCHFCTGVGETKEVKQLAAKPTELIQ